MKADYVQRGESINYANTSTETILAGSVILLNKRIAVAGCDILPMKLGSAHTVGVFAVAKADTGVSFAPGEDVYYSAAGATVMGDILMGWAVEPSGVGTSVVNVKIG